MVERMVQVSAELVEHVRWVFNTMNLGPNVVDALTAVLSQPNPSAEPCMGGAGCTAPVHLHGCFADRGDCNSPDEHTPPRIEDMAPGTELTADYFRTTRRVRVIDPGGVWLRGIDDESLSVRVDDLDPSTIRDVTPPSETPEVSA